MLDGNNDRYLGYNLRILRVSTMAAKQRSFLLDERRVKKCIDENLRQLIWYWEGEKIIFPDLIRGLSLIISDFPDIF